MLQFYWDVTRPNISSDFLASFHLSEVAMQPVETTKAKEEFANNGQDQTSCFPLFLIFMLG